MASLSLLGFATNVACLLLSCLVLSDAVKFNVTLSPNYNLTYEVKMQSRPIIEFTITANATGWVGLGINEYAGNMLGADLFIGGVQDNFVNTTYAGDYYVRRNATSLLPIRDRFDNWWIDDGTQTSNATILNLYRYIDTLDFEHDTIIQNKTMYVLWSFNKVSDDVTSKHTQRGARGINLLAGADIPPITTTTTRTTPSTRRTTPSTRTTTPSKSTTLIPSSFIIMIMISRTIPFLH